MSDRLAPPGREPLTSVPSFLNQSSPPPSHHPSIKVFEADQAAHLLEYTVNSYYRHFRLYKYIFSVKVVHRITQLLPQEVEVCRPSLPSLDSGLCCDNA